MHPSGLSNCNRPPVTFVLAHILWTKTSILHLLRMEPQEDRKVCSRCGELQAEVQQLQSIVQSLKKQLAQYQPHCGGGGEQPVEQPNQR